MLRQDVFFAERNFSENYCIKRLQKATEMNSYSSKRKRTDEQCSGPEAASIIYERPEMGFLTMPFTSGTHTEVEHPRKRFHPSTDQAVLQNTGTTRTLDRVALSGANQVLSDEQIQQFINSTVFARHETITKPGSAINVGYWSRGQSESRPNQQNFQASRTQEIRVATQINVAPQDLSFTSVHVQQSALKNKIVPRKQTQQCPTTTMCYGQAQSSVQKAEVGEIYSRTNSGKNGQHRQYVAVVSDQICPDAKKRTDKRRTKSKKKTREIPQGSHPAPDVAKVNNSNNQQSSVGLTTTHHVTSGDHFQKSPTKQPEPWSLVPQPVLMHVKPIEAQTNQTISKLMALREAEKSGEVGRFENNGNQQVFAKRKLNNVQSDCTGRKRKNIKGQNEIQFTERAGGKKTVKRIVVPPKIRQNPISYPPYVNRIMKILARGQQNQTETSDDIQDSNEKHTQIGTNKLWTESVSKEIKEEATTSRNVEPKKFLKDLSCDAILNTDNFYGPEMFVTSGDQCLVGIAPSL